MPKDTDQSQPSGSPSKKASAEKIRADLHAAGLMRLLDTPPEAPRDAGVRIVRKPGSNVIPFRRGDDPIPIRPAAANVNRPPATWRRGTWKRPVATGLYLLMATAVAYLVGSGWSG